jgi:predicted dinucleotide-binding enzyme
VQIAIIGAGNMGSALAQACTASGHAVVLSAEHAEHAAKVAANVGGQAAGSNAEAVEGADMAMLAVPSTSVASIVEDLRSLLDGKIVVDPTNPVNLDYTTLLAEPGSVAEAAQVLLPEATVVKAFNTLFASRITNPVVDGQPWTASTPATTTRPRPPWRGCSPNWASARWTPAHSWPRACSSRWRC